MLGVSKTCREIKDRIYEIQYDRELLKAENEKLRGELAKWERLADGIDLPEYPVTQFKPKDLERENEKLREWCSELLHMAESNDTDFLHWPEIHDELRKLGVEIVKL